MPAPTVGVSMLPRVSVEPMLELVLALEDMGNELPVDDELLMGAGVTARVVVSSTFLPQAPRASKATSAAAPATGLNVDAYIAVSFLSIS